MYPEFIAIYAGLAVLIVLAVVIIILQAKILGGGVSASRKSASRSSSKNGAGSIVFCKNCATQYSSGMRCCPKCGTPR